MPDPSVMDAADAAKVGGGFGLGGAMLLLLQRAFGGQDKVLARLDRLSEDVGELKTSLAVLQGAVTQREADMTQLRETVSRMQNSHANLRAVVARIDARLGMTEGEP